MASIYNMLNLSIINGRIIGKNPAPDSGRLFGHSGKTGKILLYKNLLLLLIKRYFLFHAVFYTIPLTSVVC
jgi:hypothetical protein